MNKIHIHWILLTFIISLCYGCLEQSQDNDPVVVLLDYPIAYVKRTLPVNNQGNITQVDLLDLEDFNAGGDLYLRDRASPSATEKNITFQFTGGLGDVKDVESSADGSKLIFAMHGAEDDDNEEPTWNIWEYIIETDTLQRVIISDITADAGDDISPYYLTDGRIVFSSTRQRNAGATLLDEGKPRFTAETEARDGPAFVLHVMDSDGSNITQISFNQSHDIDPTVLSNGDIVFGRWDNMGSQNAISLYKINADGTNLEIIYGAHSHNTGTNNSTVQFSQFREMEDGRIASRLIPFRGTNGSGNIVAIDIDNHLDNKFEKLTNQVSNASNGQTDILNLDIYSDNTISPDGYISSFYPLWDSSNRALISWSPCRLVENDIIVPCTEERLTANNPIAADPLYGLYIYDLVNGTQLPIVVPEEGMIIQDAVATYARDNLAPPNSSPLNSSFADEIVGVLNIRSVYDMDGVDTSTSSITDLADPAQTLADQRSARFLRIVKAVPLPDRDFLEIPNTAFGRSNQLMREIIGYAPIEPDGSIMVKVPANVPLAISVLDKNGRRISNRHQNWLQVQAGETKQCNGCHNHNNEIPHGNNDGPNSIYAGATLDNSPFPNTDISINAEISETMAETLARISCETDCAYLSPSVNINYTDSWTDINVRDKDEPFSYLYADMTTTIPTTTACQSTWTPLCRVIIHYETHIHPLWAEPRSVLNPDTMVVEDKTCTNCHTNQDIGGDAMLPEAQLDLSDGLDSDVTDHFKSYRELLFPDNELEIVDNQLQDFLEQATDNTGNLLFETDEDGEQILDINGDPIPIMVPARAVGPSMSANGANNGYFLAKFDIDGSHEGWLSDSEKKLISEWLDIGAQYYNNPFDIPAP